MHIIACCPVMNRSVTFSSVDNQLRNASVSNGGPVGSVGVSDTHLMCQALSFASQISKCTAMERNVNKMRKSLEEMTSQVSALVHCSAGLVTIM